MSEAAYISHVTANLPALDQKGERCHPFLSAQTSLARKVVQVRDQPLHNVFEARIFCLVVDLDRVGRDIVNGQVQKLWR